MIETYKGVVYPIHLDHMGHMNVQWYTAKFDEANWNLFSIVGLTSSYFREQNRGMAAVEQKTNYLAEAHAGDLLKCLSGVLEVKDKTLRVQHQMFNIEEDKLIAKTELVCAHLDRVHRRACTFPENIKKQCEEHLIVL